MKNHSTERESIESFVYGEFRPVGLKALWLGICNAMPTRRLALWARKPLKKAFGKWIDVEVWGLKLRLATRGNLTEQRLLFMANHYDSTEREFMRSHLRSGSVFLDIGANIGAYSLYAASLGISDLRIEAFEPDPDLCDRLRFNIRENALYLSLNQIALGGFDGEARLEPHRENKGQNKISQNAKGLSVKIKTLQSFLLEKQIHAVDVIKIDVEGHEMEVLKPFFARADRDLWPKFLICEIGVGWEHDPLHELLESVGYCLNIRTRMNGIYRFFG